MRLHLIHFSPGGTTKQCVKNVAEGLGLPIAEEIDMAKFETRQKKYKFTKDDLVIIGFPTMTKLFGIPKEILNLLSGDETPFIGVVTCGGLLYGSGLIVLKKGMEKRGFRMVSAGAFVGQYSWDKNVSKGRPDAQDKMEQLDFGKKIYDKVIVRGDRSFNSKLRFDGPPANSDALTRMKCIGMRLTPDSFLGSALPKSGRVLEVSDKCIKCKKCLNNCPMQAISLTDEKIKHNIDKCIGCLRCLNGCPKEAISYTDPFMIRAINASKPHFTKWRKPLDMFL